jgi:hypothetical protein
VNGVGLASSLPAANLKIAFDKIECDNPEITHREVEDVVAIVNRGIGSMVTLSPARSGK